MINLQLLKDGEHFTRYGCGVNSHYYEITKEEYDRITAIENYKSELTAEIESQLSDSIRLGYGFYGCGLTEDTDKGKCYYFEKIGNSCD